MGATLSECPVPMWTGLTDGIVTLLTLQPDVSARGLGIPFLSYLVLLPTLPTASLYHGGSPLPRSIGDHPCGPRR